MIEKFRKFATLHDVHVTLVIHPRKEVADTLTGDSIFGGAKATQEADNVILLQKEEVMANVTRKYVEVVKNRFSGDLGSVPLFFNKGTYTMSKAIFSKAKKPSNPPTQKIEKEESDDSRPDTTKDLFKKKKSPAKSPATSEDPFKKIKKS